MAKCAYFGTLPTFGSGNANRSTPNRTEPYRTARWKRATSALKVSDDSGVLILVLRRRRVDEHDIATMAENKTE